MVCEQYYMGGAKPFGHLEGRCRQAFVTSLYSFWAKLRYIWLSLAFLNIKVDMGSGITWLRCKTSLVKLSLSLTRSSMLLISGSDQFESGFTLVEFDMVYVPVVPVGCVEQGHFKEEIGRCSLETSYIPFVELIV